MMTITDPGSSLQRIVVSVISASSLPLVMITWGYYLLGRSKFLSFFTDWKEFEEEGRIYLEHGKIKRLCRIIYFSYWMCCTGLFFIFVELFLTIDIASENEFMATHYPEFLELYWVDFWLRSSYLVTALLSLIFLLLVEIVPVLVYYHVSKMISAMEVELKSVFLGRFHLDVMTIKHELVKSIWFRFEKLRVLLTRADNLFGPLLILSHGINFFILCSTVFSLLNMVRQPHEREYLSIFVMSLLFTPVRILFSFVMISKVYKAAGSLLSTVACLSACTWRPASASSSSDCVIQCFLHRLQNTKLAASPSDLYKIKPSILLTFFGLIVSYTIILVQSNSK